MLLPEARSRLHMATRAVMGVMSASRPVGRVPLEGRDHRRDQFVGRVLLMLVQYGVELVEGRPC